MNNDEPLILFCFLVLFSFSILQVSWIDKPEDRHPYMTKKVNEKLFKMLIIRSSTLLYFYPLGGCNALDLGIYMDTDSQ